MGKPRHAMFLGVDVGTQGVRVTALNEQGDQVAKADEVFPFTDLRQTQSPDQWWESVQTCLRAVASQLARCGCLDAVTALSVTSTSGTVIPLDNQYRPLHRALMYSDDRSTAEARRCREVAELSGVSGYTEFNSSSGLSKIVWFVEHYPEQVEKIGLWCHATDYLIGQLTGVWGVSDYTSVLKTGYDVEQFCWPEYLEKKLSLPLSWFPKVVPPGTVIGPLRTEAAKKTGLPKHLQVVVGLTDGCASQIAGGAVSPGDWSTTIGTTLVVKGVTYDKLDDAKSCFYNHRHPQGYWMPGGASNTGADWVAADYSWDDVHKFNRTAKTLLPTRLMAWPLLQKGERFPFSSPEARGFYPQSANRALRYASSMEGVAYIEKMAYDRVATLTGQSLSYVYTAGGASNNEVWLQIRSNILGVPIRKMRHPEGAVGAAVVAAAGTYFTDIQTAAQNMLQQAAEIEPEKQLIDVYRQLYGQFVSELVRRGYLSPENEQWKMGSR